MKSMTCKQLGGACDLVFQAETFEAIGELSKAHGMEMMQKNDAAHMEAMNAMHSLMQSPADMKAWFDGKRVEFDALPQD